MEEKDLKEEMINDESVDKETKKEKKNKLKQENEALKEAIKALKEAHLRNVAEVENFKKRMNQERITDRKYASKNLVTDLLLPLEQLNMAVKMQTEEPILKNFLIGFKMINDQFYSILENDGIKIIDALEKPFDPNYHYAVEKISDKDKANGINVEVVQTGYMYKDQILRPAMVKVNEWSDENGEDK